MLSPAGVLKELFAGPNSDSNWSNLVWHVRLPRGLACLCVGGILGGVGSAFQALFRNPLADPYVVGVSSGAATGGVIAMLAGLAEVGGGIYVDAAAFIGGMLSLALVLVLAGKRGATNVVTLLLSGVVVGSMLSGVLSLAILASGRDATQLLRWLLGNTYNAQWPGVAIMAVALVAGGIVLAKQAKSLNVFAIGEETARRLGINTHRLKAIVLITGAAMTAVAVGSCGLIAFLGLAAPHISRSLLGVDWRRSLVGSIVVGSCLLLIADVLTQRVIPLATGRFGFQPVIDLPVGVVTALIGAPSLLILLRRQS
jgi:iron complex transport system permease protein